MKKKSEPEKKFYCEHRHADVSDNPNHCKIYHVECQYSKNEK